MTNTLRDAIRMVNRKVILCGSAATLAMLASGVQAQDDIEEVVVQGVRAAQESAVNTKRNAVSVVDGISAEDIGKLPDVTIADSLQRIPGVQVTRTAGEGGPVQIRGLGNVGTMLNGETFLSATTIDQSAADFGDLPSTLFSGADIMKSAVATVNASGISGVIDLKTRRPFDMDDGWTFAATGELDQGSISKENDPTVTALVNWKNDRVGFLLAGATTEKNLASDFNGYFDTSENGGIGATNNSHTWGETPLGDPNIHHLVPQGFAAFHKAEERHRDGLNASFQADLGEGFELVADYFYSDQERWNRRAGVSQNNRWQTFAQYATATEYGGDSFTYEGAEWRTATAFSAQPYRLQSFAQTNYNHETSQNANLELNYDNDGALSGQVRVTRADADASMRHGYGEGDLLSIDKGSIVTGPGGLIPASQCDTSRGDIVVGANGGCFAAYAPGGIESRFRIGYDVAGDHPTFSGFDQVVNGGKGQRTVAEYMADVDSYHIGAFSSENNTDDVGAMDTFSTRWNYEFTDTPFISSVDFGFRDSKRTVETAQFSYFGKLNGGCAAQWKAVDQFAGSAVACDPDLAQGELVTGVDQTGKVYNNQFVNYTLLQPTRLDEHNKVMWVDDFGGVKGLPGAWVIDPRTFDNSLAFQEKVFGAQEKFINPGQSFGVELGESSYFLQANIEQGIVSGNFGLKVVETDLSIKANEVGEQLPHSGTNVDLGDVVTNRKYTDYLPSLNLAADLTDDVKVRAAYSKRMQPLNLLQWGGGKSVGRVFNNDCGCMRVNGGNLNGNPNLDPTRSENFDISAEWYLGSASMLSAGLFLIEIDSFVEGGTVMLDEPDADGIRRGPWQFTSLVQGKGGEVKGLELAAKVALSDVTDAPVLTNMGFDVNYTMSESSQEAKGFGGKELPFNDNSKNTYNLVAWYENEVVSARVAYNFRSSRLMTAGSPATAMQSLYQDDYGQMDVNVTYNVNDQWSVYLNGSNVLEEIQQTYVEFEDQKAFQNIYEARWALGARFKF
ncbi:MULTISPECIES: TonB-dependent receptor [Cellvibrio]|uniref:TonB-dependent receptor n=1 Tax=Cellvibrio fibrivorans TaxID=126350 RepID=A0ABU1UUB4_9GAMM|nr:TonB-dependent receptor [Cellvibrio fibrivorans]MDR7088723.1 TonB-dependent receptor [Cellvibrio fibrivorans]